MPRQRRRHGGQRTPRDPAAVSGPGRLARRTDGGPTTDLPTAAEAPAARHGERQVAQAIQSAGPGAGGMGAPPQGAPPPAAAGTAPGIQDPFAPAEGGGDPFARPGQQPTTQDSFRESEQYLDTVFLGAALPVLEAIASRPGTSVATRNIVRRLRSQLPPEFDMAEILSITQSVLAEEDEEAGRDEDNLTPRGEERPA